MSGYIRIVREPCMTDEQAASFTKRSWWARNETTGQFVDFGGRRNATSGLDIELLRGYCYTIGAGPPEHYRETVDLSQPPGVAPCIKRGCSGVVPFELEHTLTRVAEDDQDTPERLCADCRGAT